MEASTIIVICGFFILGVLAAFNWRELHRDCHVAHTSSERRFVREELRRVRLRTAGWFLLFGALMGRILTDGVVWDVVTVIIAALSVGSFLADGILGRYYRQRWLRKG